MSQNALAVRLGSNQQFVSAMEKNGKCLTNKAVTFIAETEKLAKTQLAPPIGQEGQKGSMEVVDSKETLATKNEGHGHFKSESVNSQQQSTCLGLA
jgi:hypothetical protein